MRLYKTELYKICHRKLFVIGTLLTLSFPALVYSRDLTGWVSFPTMYSAAMMETGLLLLCLISTVFSHEEQTKVKSLLLTTPEGPARDIRAKIAAAYTVTILLWLISTLNALIFFSTDYGWTGLGLSVKDTLQSFNYHADYAVLMQPYGLYLAECIMISFLASLELCAVTLAISARCRNTFHSLCASIFCAIMPVIAFFMMRGIYSHILYASDHSKPAIMAMLFALSVIYFIVNCLIFSSPYYLVWPNILVEISGTAIRSHGETGTILFVVTLGCIITILCIIYSYRRYREPYTD